MAINSRSCWKSRFIIPAWLAWCCLGLTGMQLERLLLVFWAEPLRVISHQSWCYSDWCLEFRLVFRVWEKNFFLLPPFLLLLEKKKPNTQKGLAARTGLLSEWYVECVLSMICFEGCWGECMWCLLGVHMEAFSGVCCAMPCLGKGSFNWTGNLSFWLSWLASEFLKSFFLLPPMLGYRHVLCSAFFFFFLVFWGRASL